eukprot:TRINITY_DN11642_c0_g1_i2.p1 TRINITY_DN11642_c0_g1~~TRINITY_DN11642_c0_g1_i2.p1  ORF type:complete len:284 (-),score=14.90 TRINITY_DN11642_c0_g1_i2:89-940(-)
MPSLVGSEMCIRDRYYSYQCRNFDAWCTGGDIRDFQPSQAAILFVMGAKKQPQTEQVTLKATGLGIGYSGGRNQATLLHENLNLELKAGELTYLLGPNGAGKSTLIRTLVGFQPRLAGEVSIGGRPIKGYSESEYAKLVSVVLTERSLVGGMTVRELVGMGRYPHTGYFGILRTKDHRVVERAIAQVGIAELAGKYVSELSDGERQKAMIAKALAQETPIIILDEPTAFLDLPSKPMYSALIPVSYTHLTLPTICSVQISVVAVSLKKKKKMKSKADDNEIGT